MEIPGFITTIRLQMQKRYEKLLTPNNPVVCAASMKPIIQGKIQWWCGPAHINRFEVKGTVWFKKLHTSTDGQGLTTAAEFPAVLWWISNRTLVIYGHEYIMAIKVRATAMAIPARWVREPPGELWFV